MDLTLPPGIRFDAPGRWCMVLLLFCGDPLVGDEIPAAQPAVDERLIGDTEGLEHVMRVTSRIYSGGQPQGSDGFAALQRLRVKTIVSVDGARPEVETATQYGLRYVHIPIGYDGVPPAAVRMLVRLMNETEGLIYIHCHHGRHRAPAAAAIAGQITTELDASAAIAILRRAGTSPEFAGLWQAVRHFTPPRLDSPLPELAAIAEVPTLAALMADADRHFDDLQQSASTRWQFSAGELSPTEHALLLHEALAEAARMTSGDEAEPLGEALREASGTARRLTSALRQGALDEADRQLTLLGRSCRDCHVRHRDR